eukprot:TRINITY_DN46875_c0_g1_i1.p1 TRINITY_DN46875_c0_g1~~TRINITY_DN46875_c0_g1_i1.p1  ORF type:complete len:254 (-),score=13.27 TRINITY_DN46875_c0_g1_i1:557-1318(-)
MFLYEDLPAPFRLSFVTGWYCTPLETMRLEAACKSTRAMARVGYACGLSQQWSRNPLAIVPPWRKALCNAIVVPLRSMSNMREFTRSKLSDIPSPRLGTIGAALDYATHNFPGLLGTFVRERGQALLVVLPTSVETYGRRFQIESAGRVANNLPIFLQISDVRSHESRKRRKVSVSVYGNTRLMPGKRIRVSCVPASAHAWSEVVHKEEDGIRLPFLFLLQCEIHKRDADFARLIIIYIEISTVTEQARSEKA